MSEQASAPHLAHKDRAPAYWFLDILWIVLAGADETDGRFTVMEQLMPEASGPGPHVHPAHDEWFYVMQGALEMQLGTDGFAASEGQSVFIPRGCVHAFKVMSPTCRVLNGFTPAAMDDVLRKVARPAERRDLPPPGLDRDPEKLALFANNEIGRAV